MMLSPKVQFTKECLILQFYKEREESVAHAKRGKRGEEGVSSLRALAPHSFLSSLSSLFRTAPVTQAIALQKETKRTSFTQLSNHANLDIVNFFLLFIVSLSPARWSC